MIESEFSILEYVNITRIVIGVSEYKVQCISLDVCWRQDVRC